MFCSNNQTRIKNKGKKIFRSMVVHAYSLSTGKPEMGKMQVWGQAGKQLEFQGKTDLERSLTESQSSFGSCEVGFLSPEGIPPSSYSSSSVGFSAPRCPTHSHILSPLLLPEQTALALSRLFLCLSALEFSRYSWIFSFFYPKWKPSTNIQVTLAVSIMSPLPKPRRSTNGPLSKGLSLS